MPTTETFWNQMGAYNEATLPMQIMTMIMALVLTYFAFAKASPKVNTLMRLFLSFSFAWTGIVFFLIFAWSTISVVASALFIIVAILFAIDIFKKKTEFRLPTTRWRRYLTFFLDRSGILVPGNWNSSWSPIPRNLHAYGPLPANCIGYHISCSCYTNC